MASRTDYLSPTQEFPDHATFRAAGAHRDQPVSVRFELVGAKEALHHRFLAYSSPSRSPNPRHLTVLTRPGFVRAAPTLPGTPRIRLPSATLTCCDRPTVQVSHLHSINKRLTAHGAPPPDPRVGGMGQAGAMSTLTFIFDFFASVKITPRTGATSP
jgi:hypothetical protein